MIPTREQAQALWDKYALPDYKRNHVTLVSAVALYLADKLAAKGVKINKTLLEAAALLHDIDKNVSRLPGEKHPDAGVRVLEGSGMREVAELVRRHPLHAILDPQIAPDTREAKLLFLSDKMVKHEIITVDKRFALWRAEDLPEDAKDILDRTYPLVKLLESEVFSLAGVTAEEIAQKAAIAYTNQTDSKYV